MGKLNLCGYLILWFYPTCEIHENLMHAKNRCFTVTFSAHSCVGLCVELCIRPCIPNVVNTICGIVLDLFSALMHFGTGFADLNQCNLNHRFKLQFKSTDFFVKRLKWFKSYWFHLPMKNYNKQKQMYSFILLFNLFNSSTTDFTVMVQELWFCATCNSQCLRGFGPQSCLYLDALQHNINWKSRKYEFFESWFKKNLIFLNHDFSNTGWKFITKLID